MIYLDKATVYAKARQAYAEGRLQAQDPAQAGDPCTYSGPCAIGVSLPPFEGVLNINNIQILEHDGVIGTDCISALRQLQVAHDEWQVSRNTEHERCFVEQMYKY